MYYFLASLQIFRQKFLEDVFFELICVVNTELLASMVKDLILERDEVFLPGLGSFVAEVVPAYFSDKGFTLNPPYRRLYFRGRASSDDDSLVALYADANGIGTQEAMSVLSDFASELKEKLARERSIVLPGLGRLRMTRENIIFFVADEDLDIYPEGFGLDTVSLKSEAPSAAPVPVAAPAAASTEPLAAQEPAAPSPEASESEAREATVPQPETQEPAAPQPEAQGPETEESASENPAASVSPAPAKSRLPLRIAACAAGVAIVAATAFFALAAYAPDLLDRILYSSEELEVIRQYSALK